jgi:hypothetical protein
MNTSSRIVLARTGALALLFALSTEARADHVIDAFSDPLSAQCPPGPPEPFLWAGRWGGVGTSPACTVSQSALLGVVGKQRTLTVKEPSLSNFVTASMVTEPDGQDAIGYGTGLAPSGILTLEYGVFNPLNLNLSADRAFQLTIEGDMDKGASPRPVKLTIIARSGAGAKVSVITWIDHDGVYQIPFTSFVGVTFSKVDYLSITLDASAVSGVDYDLIGGVRTVAVY